MQVAFQDAWIGKLLNGLVLLFITLLLVSWVTVARLVRGEVLAVKQKEFVEAARAIGANGLQVVLRHIVPNTLGPVIVVAAYIVPGAIISEAILSYLGIGIRPSVRLDAPFPTSWGSMILEGFKAWESQPWMLIAPTLAVASITLALTLIGDGLRDAFDPRQAER
jgi:oligopeptide transport system permease protein